MVSKQFNLKMWVCVSDNFDMKQILKDMIACAKKKEPTEVAMDWLQSELRGEIDGKTYLLVLDDLWNAEQETWSRSKTLLLGGARGSKILVTTRLPLVAKITGTTAPHYLQGLSEDASLNLLLQMTRVKKEEIADPAMLANGRKIVQKCSGVPLVLRVVGSILFLTETSEWAHFLEDELPQVFEREDSIMSVLRLSYDRLPSHLKQCFAFCSLFPKDYEIKKQTLINLWVAGGFIQPSMRSQHLEDIAHGYFMDLLWKNFFEDFRKDSDTNKEICKMPALMHDLACKVAGSECWKAGDDPNSILEATRHISHGLISNLMCELPMNSRLKASSMRTILSVPTYREMEQRKLTSEADICQLIQSFKRLRIFDLHAAIVKKVPRSICKLTHLTYLDLSHNDELKRLPNSITRLHNLQTLNLQGCSALEELPRDIGKLVNLRNLDIDHCYSLSYVPHGLEHLSSLNRLTRFILPKGKALAKSYSRLGELKGLNDLSGSLSIENLGHSRDALEESREANLAGKRSLESLILGWHYLDIHDAEITDEALLEELRPHSNLQQLTISGYEGKSFPSWMMDNRVDSLPNLVEVRLLRCGRIEHISQLGQLSHLKSLELWGLTELEDIESDQSPTSTTPFPSLLKLEIRYCKKLKAMPQTPHLEELSLREVNLDFFTQMIGLNKLKSLDISQMESLKCMPEECLQSLSSLERLQISECPQLTSLSGSMRHLLKLMDLSVSNCEKLDLSKDGILDLQGLEKLRSVDILGVPKLASLPQWLLPVNNLEHLSIKKCLNLKDLPEQIEGLQSLQKLEIIRCPSLTSVPEGMLRLPSLTSLRIAGCPELEERLKNFARAHPDRIKGGIRMDYELEYYERHL
ncbi:putative disease resistance protein RGA4 [Rhodamnia argentea]|uniref:Disease resistance protein RGA4 n=1 Tax=Rhodamnia argentea TaxID=178133 RepID=A0A8B8Q194_9MYRT|nr:putative disease resistance protein RGA4 [Rhodamnia argentea]